MVHGKIIFSISYIYKGRLIVSLSNLTSKNKASFRDIHDFKLMGHWSGLNRHVKSDLSTLPSFDPSISFSQTK